MSRITIESLAKHLDLLPTLCAWFESEWPGHYGPNGRGDARRDLLAYANLAALPLGLLAFRDGEACGFAALKSEAFSSHPQLMPWAGAAYVKPSLRQQGIGSVLLTALESQALALGYRRLYCATATSASLLLRCEWRLLEPVIHEGEQIGIYQKSLE